MGRTLGIASVIALDLTVVYIVSIREYDAWANFLTIMILFLVAEGFAYAFDRVFGSRGNDFTVQSSLASSAC